MDVLERNTDGKHIDREQCGGGQRMPDKDNFMGVVEPVAMSDRKGNNGVSEDGTALTLTAQEKERPIVVTKEMNNAIARNQILRVLQEAYGTEEIFKWSLAILERVQQADILQQGVHESRLQGEAENWNKLDDGTLPCASVVAEWILRDLREQSECGCASQGWQPTEQRYEELAEIMSQLPHESTQAAKVLLDMWSKSERIWLLQQALSAVQEIWESAMGERTGGGGAMTSVVRRLTPLE